MRDVVALITGGAGFIGSHLSALLLREGYQVVVVDSNSSQSKANFDYLGIEPECVEADIRQEDALGSLGSRSIDVIFHLAGNANVPLSVSDPLLDFRSNVAGTLNVLEFARKHRVRKLVFPSTASIYAPGGPMPIHESSTVRASSPYGAAKIAGENYCYAYHQTYGLDTTVLRFFNVFGPLMRRWVIHDIVRKLQANPARLEVMGDGMQIREYLYVEDAARALLLAAGKGEPGGVYNAGTGQPVRIRDLAGQIISLMGLREVEVTYTNKSWPGDIKQWYADTRKIQALGFVPQVPWISGLEKTIRFLSNAQEP